MKRSLTMMGSCSILMLTLALAAVPGSVAQDAATAPPPPITISELAGTWTATVSGVTGCGVSTLTTTFKLNSSGVGKQTNATLHTVGCGDESLNGLSAQIQSMNADGSGFLALGCGTGCGFGFNIQVIKNKLMFNMGPQSVTGNYLAGSAVKKNL